MACLECVRACSNAFYKEFNDIGEALEKTTDTYHKAVRRLKGEGKSQSVVKAAEKLVLLGVKKSKEQSLPARLVPDEGVLELVEDASAAKGETSEEKTLTE